MFLFVCVCLKWRASGTFKIHILSIRTRKLNRLPPPPKWNMWNMPANKDIHFLCVFFRLFGLFVYRSVSIYELAMLVALKPKKLNEKRNKNSHVCRTIKQLFVNFFRVPDSSQTTFLSSLLFFFNGEGEVEYCRLISELTSTLTPFMLLSWPPLSIPNTRFHALICCDMVRCYRKIILAQYTLKFFNDFWNIRPVFGRLFAVSLLHHHIPPNEFHVRE